MMTGGKEILHKIKVKAGFSLCVPDLGKGKGKVSKNVTHGHDLVKGKSNHAMEDFVVSEFKQVDDNDLGLFAVFDGHLGHAVANYLQNHLFANILKEHDFWTEIEQAIRRAYRTTDAEILDKAVLLGKGGSTAVTAILINGQKLVVANVGDSRAVICKNGIARQLSVDHEPSKEKRMIETRGGFVSNLPGDVPRVDGQLAVARTFGDKSLKIHLSSEPDVAVETIDDDTEFIILASDGIWTVMSNQDAVDSIKHIKDANSAAKHLIEDALSRRNIIVQKGKKEKKWCYCTGIRDSYVLQAMRLEIAKLRSTWQIPERASTREESISPSSPTILSMHLQILLVPSFCLAILLRSLS
ncbi:PP2C domain-containing protein [Cephalotus follicularis]|uniref:protein-serine/threonine phosphatase n=1 Tax=Cephalotus follicularis TaxID=3775 RepID=A0A1Q3C1A3_CEPFO|nr:PP2C domain-containing protein [Cephalotus follicularis]